MLSLVLNTLEHHMYFSQFHMRHTQGLHYQKRSLSEKEIEKHLQDLVFAFYQDQHRLVRIQHKNWIVSQLN